MHEMPHMRVDICRKLIASRKVVGECLGYGLCPNPIWDMALQLFLATQEGRPSYLWSLCMFANVPLSTALRKVDLMEAQGVVARVRLTSNGLETIEKALDRLIPIYATAPEATLFAAALVPFPVSAARSA